MICSGHEDFSVTDFLEIEQDEPVDPNDEDHVETFENVSAIHDPLFFPVRKRYRFSNLLMILNRAVPRAGPDGPRPEAPKL